jgi:ABC-type bacteriocin/lantibiotic exporter with double-glycine peptidase domain
LRPLSKVSLSRVRRLLPFISGFRYKLAIIFALSFSNTILGLLGPIFTKILIDDVLQARNLRLLWILSGIMIAVTLVSYVLGAFNRYYYTSVTARVLFNLRQHLFEHLQALPMRFHVRAKVGDLLSRLNTDIAEVQSMLTDAGFNFIANIFTLFAATGFLLWLNWKLFLLSLTLVPLQLYGVAKFRPLIVSQTRTVRELNAAISSFLVESLSAIKFVKLFVAEKVQHARLSALGVAFVNSVTRLEMLSYLGSSASAASTFLGSALVTLYGGYLVIEGKMTIGSLVAFSAYQMRAFSPLQALIDLYLRLQRAGVSVDRIFEFLDLPTESDSAQGTQRLPEVRGEIEFRHVSFSHDPAVPILDDLSFKIPAGGRLTIVGPSGAGKTSIVDLMTRLIEPRAGSILLDGHELRNLDLVWLRSQLVVTGHQAFVFHASMMENLRYACPDASLEQVTAAARAVGLHDFISSLPDGYDNPVGEHGATLSDGQRQRISIARALLKDPKILVLDEALSALDVVSEAEIRTSVERALPGRTVIMITHRLSSIRQDDQVMVLDQGRVVWSGRYCDHPDGLSQKIIPPPQERVA